jgi:hypothetical protein
LNLLTYIQEKPKREVTIGNETKESHYYDALVHAMYWNNLNSVSAKYKFVIENYLSDQFERDDINYSLPKNKKLYEIAYM